MKAAELHRNPGQSFWLDNITHDLPSTGTLERYIGDLWVSGLISNPAIFEHAIQNSRSYDEPILEKLSRASPARNYFSKWL